MIVSVLSCLSSRQPRSHKFLPLTVLCNDAQSYFVLGMPTRRAATPGNWTIPPTHLAQLCWHINEYKKIIVWVSSINKLVPQKRNAEISESDDAFHLPEEVDNATGMDLPWQQCRRRRVEGRGTRRGQKSCPSPQENPALDGDDVCSSSSGSGGDSEVVGGIAGAWGRRLRAPYQGLIHSSAKTILILLTHLWI